MQTRSKGKHNLLPLNNNIFQLQRNIKAQKNRERAAQLAQSNMDHPHDQADNAYHGDNDQHGVIPPRPPPIFPPVQAQYQRRGRQIGAGDTPRAHHTRYGIVPPPFENNNFEIKSSTIQNVECHKFHGLNCENPISHLDQFDRYCNLFKNNGVSEDAFKLRLFPFSLGGKAEQWEKQIPSASITTWAQCKDAFLAKFYSPSRTARMRGNISNFSQKANEDFSDALERFKTAINECPHHGFTDETLLSTLYRGVLPKVKTFLDSASNGSFLSRDVDAGWELVENMASSYSVDVDEYDRHTRGQSTSDSMSRKEMNALTEKLDRLTAVDAKLDKLLSTQSHRPVHMIENHNDISAVEEEEGQFEELCYMQNQGNSQRNRGSYGQNPNTFQQPQGTYNAYRQNPTLPYRNQNAGIPPAQAYQPPQQHAPPPPYAPRQPYHTNNFKAAPTHPPGYQAPPPLPPPQHPASAPDVTTMFQQLLQKIDGSHTDLNNKFEQLSTRMSTLENQQASSSVRPSGQLPGKAVPNPRDHTINAITLRSGREISTCVPDIKITEDSDIQVGGEDKLIPDEEICTKEPEQTSKSESKQAKLPASNDVTMPQAQAKSFVPPPYKPQLPFPQRFKKDLTQKYKALFDHQIKDLELKIPLRDALMLIPPYQKFLKDAVQERTREVEGMVMLTHEISAII